jgi:hypothetical protein
MDLNNKCRSNWRCLLSACSVSTLVLCIYFDRANADELPTPTFSHVSLPGIATASPKGDLAVVAPRDESPYVIEIASGRVKNRLLSKEGFRTAFVIWSSDKIYGLCVNDDLLYAILEWDASKGDLLNECMVDTKFRFISTCRLSRSGRGIYFGAENVILRYDTKTKQITELLNDAYYYVEDISDNDSGDLISFVDQKPFVYVYSLVNGKIDRSTAPLEFWKDSITRIYSVDLSADGAEVAVVSADQVKGRGKKGPQRREIRRFNRQTGQVLQRLETTHSIDRIRYVGRSKSMLLGHFGFDSNGGFCFVKPSDRRLEHFYTTGASLFSMSALEEDHLTFGTDDGSLKQWKSQDWASDWKSSGE